ncbi:MAG: DNA mismatch repair protein MutS [Chloroflexi bacterium]|nr:DNA mismatch repair protein MutS [Chloroflexota bacterium]
MTTTPMRSQYLAIKKQYPDIILLFRLGDFYETFDDDAVIVSSVCDVVLTSRPVGADERVPLAGVPYHAVDGYIAKLINAGYKVAIAEQIGNEPPKGEKLVPRVVRRVVTPGTLVEPGLLPEKRNNYLAALVFDGAPLPPQSWGESGAPPPSQTWRESGAPPPSQTWGESDSPRSRGAGGAAGLAYADISTGEFATTEISDGADVQRRVAEELGRLAPAELLWPAKDPRWAGRTTDDEARTTHHAARTPPSDTIPSWLQPYHVTPYAAWRFEESTARQALLEHFRAASLDGYGCAEKPLAVRAAGALIQYLCETQRDNVAQIAGLRTYDISEYMLLDEATRRNLELIESIRGGTVQGSLLGVLDVTLTPMGGRLLRRWLNQPLLDVAALNRRLDAVTAWHADAPLRTELRGLLRGLGDLERWTNRAVQGIALPRDLVGVREGLARVEKIRGQGAGGRRQEAGGRSQGSGADVQDAAVRNTQYAVHLNPCPDIAALLAQALADEPPATLNTTGVIRPGFSAELDGIHIAIRDAREWIANLETVERQRTGIRSLKVGYNKVFGYYIEVTTANAALVPADYIRKQTLVNAERYITPELKEYEALVLNAEERILELEGQLYRQVLAQIAAAAPRLLAAAAAVAELDVFASLAEVAEANRYVRPTLADDRVIDIKAGRHPVVEKLHTGEPFTPNDAYLSSEQAIVILTGPNMSGKSSYLRQVAHIVLLAQIGAYVPADSARIGLVDRIFTRIGASDEIARGQSTFMVEMVETANILHHATNRSLLILDEIGRGTSTYDGLAIAWAVVEYIHNHPGLRAKTLFATHYHELTDLAERLPHVVNFNVAVAEQGDAVVFLHKVVPGAADRSYGVHVAQLAGLPKPVVARAQEILADLEASGAAGPRRSVAPTTLHQLSLFSREDPIIVELRSLDVNSLSPLAALNKLYELQQRVKG